MIEIQSSLAQLIGRQLSSIEFVQNYVQLRFNGITLTVIALPHVVVRRFTYEPQMRDYRNMLCSLIGHTILNFAFVEDVKLEFELSDDTSLVISLKEEDYIAAEAVIFTSDSQEWWSI